MKASFPNASSSAAIDLNGQAYLSSHFSPGRWLDQRQVNVASFTAISGSYERQVPVSGGLYTHEAHYFDMRLAARAPAAHGRLADYVVEPQPLGEIIFVPAGHRYVGGGGAGIQRNLFLFLNVGQSSAEEDEFAELTVRHPHDCMNLRCDRIRFLLTQICRELYDPGFASALMLEGLGTTLLAETLRFLHHKQQREQGRGGLSPTHMRLINELVQDSEVPPSLDDIAGACQLSRRHLMRAFRQETGLTVGEFVQRLAIEKASRLLRETDQRVTAIATSTGFSSPSAFSTAFKRATGESPREYRNRQRTLMVVNPSPAPADPFQR